MHYGLQNKTASHYPQYTEPQFNSTFSISSLNCKHPSGVTSASSDSFGVTHIVSYIQI